MKNISVRLYFLFESLMFLYVFLIKMYSAHNEYVSIWYDNFSYEVFIYDKVAIKSRVHDLNEGDTSENQLMELV